MALFILILIQTKSILVIIPVSIVLGMFTKGTGPVLQSIVADSVDKYDKLDEGYGIYSFVRSLCSVIAPLMFGFIGDLYGIDYIFYLMMIFVLVAIIPIVLFKLSDRDWGEQNIKIFQIKNKE